MPRVGVKSNIFAELWERIKTSEFMENFRNMFSFMTNNDQEIRMLEVGSEEEAKETLISSGIQELMEASKTEKEVAPEVKKEGRNKLLNVLRSSSSGSNSGASNTNNIKPDLSGNKETKNSEPIHDKE